MPISPWQPGRYIGTRCTLVLWASTQELRCWADVLNKTDFNFIAPNTPSALESQEEDPMSRGDVQDKLPPPTARLACFREVEGPMLSCLPPPFLTVDLKSNLIPSFAACLPCTHTTERGSPLGDNKRLAKRQREVADGLLEKAGPSHTVALKLINSSDTCPSSDSHSAPFI